MVSFFLAKVSINLPAKTSIIIFNCIPWIFLFLRYPYLPTSRTNNFNIGQKELNHQRNDENFKILFPNILKFETIRINLFSVNHSHPLPFLETRCCNIGNYPLQKDTSLFNLASKSFKLEKTCIAKSPYFRVKIVPGVTEIIDAYHFLFSRHFPMVPPFPFSK